tara:strand:- start:234 stop:422 length:189 start_codon:yes stop_codon:yes gene_type:complete
MNITSAKYQSIKEDDVVVESKHNIIAIIDGVKTFVPIKQGNLQYDEIIRQVDAGKLTIKDAD